MSLGSVLLLPRRIHRSGPVIHTHLQVMLVLNDKSWDRKNSTDGNERNCKAFSQPNTMIVLYSPCDTICAVQLFRLN